MRKPKIETSPSKTRNCPVCGTKLSENSKRCLVCGTDLAGEPSPKEKKAIKIDSQRIPEVRLNLVALIAIIVAPGTYRGFDLLYRHRGKGTDSETTDPLETITVTPT